VDGSWFGSLQTTGLHTVTDICCKRCDTVLGWRYVCLMPSNAAPCVVVSLAWPLMSTRADASPAQKKAYESSQKYKEGKFILETALIHEVPS
jgi:hypothetical protein